VADSGTVFRSEVTELLGLPVDVDDTTLNASLETALSEQRVQAAASTEEQRLQTEDRRLVDAAYTDGRICSRETWVNALATDRVTNRTLLASLAPAPNRSEKGLSERDLGNTPDITRRLEAAG
jgi:hypothetical protein